MEPKVPCHVHKILPLAPNLNHIIPVYTLTNLLLEDPTHYILSSKSHVHFLLLRSFQTIHPSLRHYVTFCNMLIILWWGIVSLLTNPQAGASPPLAAWQILIQNTRVHPRVSGLSWYWNICLPLVLLVKKQHKDLWQQNSLDWLTE